MIQFGNEHIRSSLLERREELMHRFNHAVVEQPLHINWMDDIDPDDVASVAILHIMEELLEVDAAIERIDDGDYGICRRCGHKIDPLRLEMLPETQFCQSCISEITDE